MSTLCPAIHFLCKLLVIARLEICMALGEQMFQEIESLSCLWHINHHDLLKPNRIECTLIDAVTKLTPFYLLRNAKSMSMGRFVIATVTISRSLSGSRRRRSALWIDLRVDGWVACNPDLFFTGYFTWMPLSCSCPGKIWVLKDISWLTLRNMLPWVCSLLHRL